MTCAMTRAMTRRIALVAAVLAAGCTRPSEQRALADLDVGAATASDARVAVRGGLAAVRALGDRALELWAQAPVLELELEVGATAAGAWTVTVRNALADSVLVDGSGAVHARLASDRPTVAVFELALAAGTHALRVAPPDADVVEPFQVAAMADIQTALPHVDEVFAAINAVPAARFVVAMGDITERGGVEEYDLFERQLQRLDIPYFSTIGNHELWAEPERFLDRFGRANFQFVFKGAAFTFADSGDAGIDPLVEDWLGGWLADARDLPHVFLTHMPPVDPVGTRYGSFRSTRDGRRLLSRLVEGGVDLTLYGHIHTYAAFQNAGIPAYISGGGGAMPMRFDDIDRHFLVVELNSGPTGIGGVSLHRVD